MPSQTFLVITSIDNHILLNRQRMQSQSTLLFISFILRFIGFISRSKWSQIKHLELPFVRDGTSCLWKMKVYWRYVQRWADSQARADWLTAFLFFSFVYYFTSYFLFLCVCLHYCLSLWIIALSSFYCSADKRVWKWCFPGYLWLFQWLLQITILPGCSYQIYWFVDYLLN